ncbi:MAG: molybdate ABC transporter permease subunit [Cellulosilyticaceae bacterium]
MEVTPLIISLKTAIWSTVLTFVLGLYAAKWTMKLKRFQTIVDTLLTLPMVLPPTVVGFLLLVLFGKNSGVGTLLSQLGITIVFSWAGTVIAAVVVSFPIMYRTARGAFEQLDPDLIYAAQTLGLTDYQIFYQIMIPNCWRGIVAGTILTFARALGEFGATVMLAGNIPGKTQTMALAVYTAVQNGDRSLAYEGVGVMVIISLMTMMLMYQINSSQVEWMKKGRGKS